MRVLHLMAGGDVGGIEVLLKDYAGYSRHQNFFCVMWGKNGRITCKMRENGVRVIELEASHTDLLSPVKKVLTLCRKEKIQVILAHHSAPLCHLILMAARRTVPGIRTVAYAHSNIHDWELAGSLQKTVRRWIFRRSYQKADGVVAISKSVRDSVTDVFRVDVGKIRVIYNGVMLSRFSPQSEDGSIRRGCLMEVIYVGRLIEEKGVQNTIRGLAQLPADLEYQFTVIGDGPYRTELEELTDESGLHCHVDFLGTRMDVPELLEAANVFIHLPEWEEGFGITLVEAMAAGKICICGKVGAIPEIIDDGVNGFLIEKEKYRTSGDVLADIGRRLYSEDMNKVRREAVRTAERFSIEHFAEELDEYLEEIGNLPNIKKGGFQGGERKR